MPGPRPARTSPRRVPRWVSALIVVVLTVIVIALATLAIARTSGEPVTGTPRPVPEETSTSTPRPTTSPGKTPTPTASRTPATQAPGAAERLLAAGGSTLWRATAGSCGATAPVLERSDDAGATWVDVTPAYLGIGQILALDSFAGDEAQMVARVGAGCETQALRTFTQGRFWQSYPDVLAASTYANPGNAAVVVVAGGEVPAPCPAAWGVRASNGTVGVVCDGTAYQLSGRDWTPVTQDAVAVAVRGAAVIAAHASQGCSGLVVGSACTGQQAPFAPAAIAVNRDTVYQWIGDRVVTVPAA